MLIRRQTKNPGRAGVMCYAKMDSIRKHQAG